jgi:hypothetical protein
MLQYNCKLMLEGKMSVSYAQISCRSSWLNTDFGKNYATKIFGEELVNSLPIASKGKNKGKIKNHFIEWDKVEKGGWVKTGKYDWDAQMANGYVERRVGKVISARLFVQEWGKPPQLVREVDLNA